MQLQIVMTELWTVVPGTEIRHISWVDYVRRVWLAFEKTRKRKRLYLGPVRTSFNQMAPKLPRGVPGAALREFLEELLVRIGD